ncbi:UNVERIFIED_CONTAM: hypothetical protein Sradi_1233700 [Sesamum radiatum]|uniref:Uncharacterized protein n=1 Tax=Sesamum radiatum TaxID=300843 RepID=A0AAW2UPB5_SESRA
MASATIRLSSSSRSLRSGTRGRSRRRRRFRKSSYRIHRKRSAAARAASSPVNVPDWSKILKEEYRENGRREGDDYEEEVEENENRIPPHEFLARTRMASFSVQDGRDLRR